MKTLIDGFVIKFGVYSFQTVNSVQLSSFECCGRRRKWQGNNGKLYIPFVSFILQYQDISMSSQFSPVTPPELTVFQNKIWVYSKCKSKTKINFYDLNWIWKIWICARADTWDGCHRHWHSSKRRTWLHLILLPQSHWVGNVLINAQLSFRHTISQQHLCGCGLLHTFKLMQRTTST